MGIYSGQESQRGFKDEARVYQWLLTKFPKVLKSTKEENREQDIDFWAYPEGKPCMKVSVKSVNPKYQSFGVEIVQRVLNYRTGESCDEPGIWLNGKPTHYVIVSGDILYMVRKSDLVKHYNDEHCYERWLTPFTVAIQLRNQHPHVNALSHYWTYDRMKELGILKKVGMLDELSVTSESGESDRKGGTEDGCVAPNFNTIC